jgi:hypothetical protein
MACPPGYDFCIENTCTKCNSGIYHDLALKMCTRLSNSSIYFVKYHNLCCNNFLERIYLSLLTNGDINSLEISWKG